MTQNQQDVLAAVAHMTQSFMDNSIADVMRSYEAQATVLFEPATPVSEAPMLEQMFTGMAALNPVFEYPAGHEVVVNGDLAIHIAPWTMTGTMPDGQAVSQNGLSVAVLRRQEDGSWKLVIDNPHGGRLLATE
ncbi:YybH family protein [Litoreibacter albidus]|uniref:YybH family protein n=1 Tax=Litoreibacter albidus TaxID=670155 RepID=UPI0037351AA4